MPTSVQRLRATLSRILRTDHADPVLHFHTGDHGRPYVCHDPRCESPACDLD